MESEQLNKMRVERLITNFVARCRKEVVSFQLNEETIRTCDN